MKKIILFIALAVVMSSCKSNKEFAALQTRLNSSQQELVDIKANLQKCLIEKTSGVSNVSGLEGKVGLLENQIKDLKADKAQSLKQVENLTVLTQSASDNIKEVVAQLSEKDKYINGIISAMTKKDSINLAIAFHLKKVLGAGIQDQDIQIDVEKTVVYISIADKLLFTSGSSTVSQRAKIILGKVAKVISARPDMEVQVEGYTDNVPVISTGIKDNWDLSVKRATSVVRVLQKDFGIAPERLIAAGRSEYVPLQSNDTAEGRAINRRTRIVILPKLEEFFDILEQKTE